MTCKITIYYNQLQSGFSETYYHASNDPVTLANSIPNSLYQNAVKWRSVDTLVKAARFSLLGGNRQSYLVRPYPTAQGAAGAGTDVGPDVVSTDAVFALQSTGGATRRVFVRGLADQDVSRDVFGNDTPSAALIAGTNKFFKQIYDQGFSIRKADKPPNAGLVYRNVLSVKASTVGDPSLYSEISYQGVDPAYVVGDVIQFKAVKHLPHFPRTATIKYVTVIAGTNWYGIAYALPGGSTVFGGGMQSAKITYNTQVIALWTFERFSERKTGRPFGSLRGRARKAS